MAAKKTASESTDVPVTEPTPAAPVSEPEISPEAPVPDSTAFLTREQVAALPVYKDLSEGVEGEVTKRIEAKGQQFDVTFPRIKVIDGRTYRLVRITKDGAPKWHPFKDAEGRLLPTPKDLTFA